jgi:hypothetical protein
MAPEIRPGFPVAGDGYLAELEVGGEHLRLFAEVASLGYLAAIYDVKQKCSISAQTADGLDEARCKAENLAADFLRYRNVGELPKVEWKPNHQSRMAQL